MARAEDLAAPAWLPQPQGHPTYRLASTGYFGEIGPVRSTRPAGPYSNLTEVWDGLDLDLFRTLGDSTRKDSALLEKPAAPPSPPASRCSSPSSELYDSSESQEVEQGAGSSAARCQLATPLECDDVKAMVQLLCNLKLQQYLPALLEEGFNHSSLLLLTYSDVHWLRNDLKMEPLHSLLLLSAVGEHYRYTEAERNQHWLEAGLSSAQNACMHASLDLAC